MQDLKFKDVLWHAGCYANYTSKTNISRVKKRQLETSKPQPIVGESAVSTLSSEMSSPTRVVRSHTSITDWSKCLFCKQLSYKKDKKLINVATWDGRDTIYAAAEAKGDAELLFALSNVSKDLVAAEGKYHRACRASYVSKANIKHKLVKPDAQEDAFVSAMQCLGEKIAPSISAGKAYCMNTLLQKYKALLTDRGIEADSYTRQRL